MNKPQSFTAAIEGCVGVFHVAQPMDMEEEEEDVNETKLMIKGLDIVDESSWSDVNFIKFAKPLLPCYSTCKTLTEKAAIEFAAKIQLHLVSVAASWIHGPFITPHCPFTVQIFLDMIFGN
ncbi:hypothetical protein MTR67_004763 [Solanum verrucosum]|uniref:Uncharacterized protein n=1 Tax=Solanum verrucosum TaxID=315347 RepID=A0AAF0TBM6_SOLVR|nr:hypothetical protein MTR67_004763 [Solanum verrucosum]